MRFKVGDKVRVRKDLEAGKRYYMDDKKESDIFMFGMKEFLGEIVTIKGLFCEMYKIKESEYVWTDEMFEPVCNNKIVIITDGMETVAKLYDGKKIIKRATAKCSPNDEFNFETGAKIAFERLIEETIAEEKPIEKKPKLKIEVGKRYMLKPYSDVTDRKGISKSCWNNEFCKPIVVLSEYGICGNRFYVQAHTGKNWYVDESSFLCECIDIETE